MNIYFVNGSLPMFYAIETQKRLEGRSICFICYCRVANHYTEKELVIAKKVFSSVIVLKISGLWRMLLSYLKVIGLIGLCGKDDFYIGNIGVSFLLLIYNSIPANKKYILEDGTSTLSLACYGVSYYNNMPPRCAKRFFPKLFNLTPSRHSVISVFDYDDQTMCTEKIVSFSAEKCLEVCDDQLLILGGPQLSLAMMDFNSVIDGLKRLIDFHRERYDVKKIYYRPHPREQQNDVNKVQNALGMIPHVSSNQFSIIELHIMRAEYLPKHICSLFPSSALFTIPHFFPQIRVSCAQIELADIDQSRREESELVINEVKRLGNIIFI